MTVLEVKLTRLFSFRLKQSNQLRNSINQHQVYENYKTDSFTIHGG